MKARKILLSVFAIIIFLKTSSQQTRGNDWAQWRGLKHDGIADSNQDPPVKFSSEENVLWSTKVPGRGHGSPTIYGGRIFLATADEKMKTQTLICFNRLNGKEIWSKEVHRGGFPQKSNTKASQASSTPATDGKLVYINFLNKGAVFTTAFDYDGNKIWQQKNMLPLN